MPNPENQTPLCRECQKKDAELRKSEDIVHRAELAQLRLMAQLSLLQAEINVARSDLSRSEQEYDRIIRSYTNVCLRLTRPEDEPVYETLATPPDEEELI